MNVSLKHRLLTCPAKGWIKAQLVDDKTVVAEASVKREARSWKAYEQHAWEIAWGMLAAETRRRSQGQLF